MIRPRFNQGDHCKGVIWAVCAVNQARSILAPPLPWAAAGMLREDPRKVALIGIAAVNRDFRQPGVGLEQLLLRGSTRRLNGHR